MRSNGTKILLSGNRYSYWRAAFAAMVLLALAIEQAVGALE